MLTQLTRALQYESLGAGYWSEAAMSLKSPIVIVGITALVLCVQSSGAGAQPPLPAPGTQSKPPSRPRAQIEINPRPLLYRRCVDWLEVQHRPSGTVLYPQYRCWWVRG